MKTTLKTQDHYTTYERHGQVVLALDHEKILPENAPVRLTSAQLEELDYRNLYRAYSSRGRKSAADPRVMFKVMVYGYQCGIYSSRKLEEACRYRVDFMWLLEEENAPDHATFARFRTGRCASALEDLFYQYVRLLEKQGETDHETVFIDGTKLESAAGRYTFVWRKTVEKQLAKVKEKAQTAVSARSLAELEQYLANTAEGIDFVHGTGRRKSEEQKEWEKLKEAIIPYLLRNKVVSFPNQVWSIDITYIKMHHGHMYLTAVIDWFSRKIVAWTLSDTLDTRPVLEAVQNAVVSYGVPAFLNSDQGSQFTSEEYKRLLRELHIHQSMDGKSRWADNIMIERWFRSLKTELIYINEYRSPRELRMAIRDYINDYNTRRPHEALDYATPEAVYKASFAVNGVA